MSNCLTVGCYTELVGAWCIDCLPEIDEYIFEQQQLFGDSKVVDPVIEAFENKDHFDRMEYDKKLAREAFKKIENNGKIQLLTLEVVDFSDYDIILDAIFGTGIEGEIKDPLATLIKNLNKAKAYKVSVDIPSGINPDSGEKANVVFEPDLIITMHDLKSGLESFKDKTVIVDIRIKKE